MTELKPCPFCLGEAVLSGSFHPPLNVVRCKGCYCSSGPHPEAEAIAAWNQRPTPAAPDGLVELADKLAELAAAVRSPNCETSIRFALRSHLQAHVDEIVAALRVITTLQAEKAAARKDALEEAAKVADGTRAYDDELQKSAGCKTVGQRIATAIRALHEQDAQG